jgi:ligand-binding sensor domain-containing protein
VEKLSQQVTAIEQDRDGNFWFGNFGNVYSYKNGEIIDWTHKFNSKPNITDIHQDRRGDLWFASGTGLFRLQNDEITRYTKNESLVSDDVKIIHESGDGTMWIGTYGGVSRLKDGAFASFTVNEDWRAIKCARFMKTLKMYCGSAVTTAA